MKSKKNLVIALVSTILVLGALSFFLIKNDNKNVYNQNLDFDVKLSKLECGSSFMVSELTHQDVIQKFIKDIKKKSSKVSLGTSSFDFLYFGEDSGKFVLSGPIILEKKTVYEVDLSFSEIAPGGYTANFISVKLVCD